MINELYNESILSLASEIPRIGRLDTPDSSSTAVSKLCGSKVIVDLNFLDGHVTDFAHQVKACSLGQASSSVMARNIIGSKYEELIDVREIMLSMLKESGPPPKGKWEALKYLQPVKDYKGRHASVMLTFDAVCECINQIV